MKKKIDVFQFIKESRLMRSERIQKSGNAYIVKVKESKKEYSRKDKGWKKEGIEE